MLLIFGGKKHQSIVDTNLNFPPFCYFTAGIGRPGAFKLNYLEEHQQMCEGWGLIGGH